MSSFDNQWDEFIWGLANVDYIHLRARYHDIACLHFRDLHYTLDHTQGIRIKKITFKCRVQQCYQLLPITRFSEQQSAEPFKPTRFR